MIIRKISLLIKAPKITGHKTVHSLIGEIQMGIGKNGKIIPGVVLGSGFPAYKGSKEQINAVNKGTEEAEKGRSFHRFCSYIAEFKKIVTRYEKCKALALDKNTPKNIVLKMINSIIKEIRTLNISIRHLAMSSEVLDCPNDVIAEISTIRSLHLIEIGKSLVSLRNSYGENK